jgi:hypothetical protein
MYCFPHREHHENFLQSLVQAFPLPKILSPLCIINFPLPHKHHYFREDLSQSCAKTRGSRIVELGEEKIEELQQRQNRGDLMTSECH